MHIALVIGTRPQIIKSAPIITESKKHNINISIIHTGQHYDYQLSKVFFNELSLPDPYINLGIGSSPHVQQIATMMLDLEPVYKKLRPDLVLVPGDTNSTLAGALTAIKMKIPTYHIESGARSFDMNMPEEVNRRIVDHISTKLYTVSNNGITNLLNEGLINIRLVGDTMYESILQHTKDIENAQTYKKYDLIPKSYCVLTLHRENNVNDIIKLNTIMRALIQTKSRIIFPCHPHTKQILTTLNLPTAQEKLDIIEPLPYFDMLNLVKNAKVVITDSGGLQKEAYWLGTQCVTLRSTTEWTETIDIGVNTLVGSDPQKIISGIDKALKTEYQDNGRSSSLLIPYASKNILEDIRNIYERY